MTMPMTGTPSRCLMGLCSLPE